MRAMIVRSLLFGDWMVTLMVPRSVQFTVNPSAIMTVTTAKVAGCKHIVACSPPRPGVGVAPAIVYAAHICGADKIMALPDPLDPDDAVKILHDPMCRAMQAGPMPPAVWRTAAQDHMLGPVAVRKGDKINISIKSATMEDLRNKKANVDAIFGGNRNEPKWGLHACPGYNLAMGIMFGTLTAVMKSGR